MLFDHLQTGYQIPKNKKNSELKYENYLHNQGLNIDLWGAARPFGKLGQSLYAIKMNIDEISKIVLNWSRKYPEIKRSYIYGSRVTGLNREDSDIDIAIELIKNTNDTSLKATWAFEKNRFLNSLQELLPYKLDLQIYDGINTEVVYKGISEAGILIYENENSA